MKVTTSQIRSDIDLAVTLRIAISRLARRIRAARAASGLPELSDTQFAALAALVRHTTMTPGELAEHEKVQPPSMTRVIAVLEQRGLLSRAPHPTDKRQVALTATAAGRSLVEQVRRLREAWLARRLRELSAQERSVLRAAAPVLEKLSQS
jgi:DNA-binding MarR family transcriptional regulator